MSRNAIFIEHLKPLGHYWPKTNIPILIGLIKYDRTPNDINFLPLGKFPYISERK